MEDTVEQINGENGNRVILAGPNYYGMSVQGPSKHYLQDYLKVDSERRLFIQADGMTHKNGKDASKTAVETAYAFLKHCTAPITRKDLQQAFTEATNAVTRLPVGDNTTSGTTLDVVVLKKDRALIGHVGDSRVYRVRKQETKPCYNSATQETQDDPIDEMDRQINYIGKYGELTIHIEEVRLKNQDLLVLCTDGVHSDFKYTPHRFEQLLLSEKEPKEVVEKVIQEVADNASFREDKSDNYSILVYQHTLPQPPAQEQSSPQIVC